MHIPIPLDTPIQRGQTRITEIQIRKPASGELRGLSLSALLNIQADAVITLLPRITTPSLTPDEAQRLDPADLTACGLEIASFLLPKRMQQAPAGQEQPSPSPTESNTPTPTSPSSSTGPSPSSPPSPSPTSSTGSTTPASAQPLTPPEPPEPRADIP